jgi:Lrp/AsnC family transcriptional regulator for asnA, asnC and gidA
MLMMRESDSHPESQPVVRQGSLPHGTIELDDVDRHIIKLLRHDGRLSYAHISRTVNLSEPTVRKRIGRLVHAGAIMNAARINPAPIGFPIDAMIGIRVVRGRVREVGRRLAQMENVAYVAFVAGSFDIIVEAFLPHTEGLFKFLNEDLDRIDGIASTETWHVLRTEKFFYNWEGEDVGLEPAPEAITGDQRNETLPSVVRSPQTPSAPTIRDR